MGYYSSVLLATTRKGYGDILKKLKANKECERLVNSMQEMGETEDGRNESYFYGEEDYDMPYIDACTRYDYEREWKMKVGAHI